MEKRKRPSIFDLVERYMERVLEEMSKLPAPTEDELARMMRQGPHEFDEWFRDPFEEMLRELDTELPEEAHKRHGPFIYGFSYTQEPGKEPDIKEFGNLKSSNGRLEPALNGEREPLVDIIEETHAYEIVAELPGVERGEITLHATEDALEIRTEGDVKYYKEVTFETCVKPETATATYRNGVLSVRIAKRGDEQKRKTPIPLE
ncbi:MAG: Hsp20/alpha crystallin family protein [Methanomicrobia archaeon]|nr:Hsp20/alpha crystallin family protein [Methanomicrobia archaeon]